MRIRGARRICLDPDWTEYRLLLLVHFARWGMGNGSILPSGQGNAYYRNGQDTCALLQIPSVHFSK